MKSQNSSKWDAGSLKHALKQRLQEFDAPAKILVACSGGLDSMLLWQLLCQVQQELKSFELLILHVNFGLRGQESDADEALVRSAAKRMNCPLKVYTVNSQEHPKKGESIQVWARNIRYAWFATQRQETDWIALAHHADDLAENIFLRLCRGHSLAGLAGMQPLFEKSWRPLLLVSRAELLQIAQEINLEWREDSSNTQTYYTRNYLRLNVFPQLEKLFPGIKANLRQHAEDVQDCLAIVQQVNSPLPSGNTLAPIDLALGAYNQRQRILHFLLNHFPLLQVKREMLVDLQRNLAGKHHKILVLAPGVRVECLEGALKVLSPNDQQSSRWQQYRGQLLAEDLEIWPDSED